MQGVGVCFPERPGNQRSVHRDPGLVQLHHEPIKQPRLHLSGTYDIPRFAQQLVTI